jgi:LytS/YehU family sensor histidine kinase
LHLLRDPGLFELSIECPASLRNIPVPPLLLLPLAENAVKHGPAAGHRGEIRVRVEERDSGALLTLENPGSYGGPRAGSDGVPTVMRRLELAYGPEGLLRIGPLTPDRTVVEVSLSRAGPKPGVVT